MQKKKRRVNWCHCDDIPRTISSEHESQFNRRECRVLVHQSTENFVDTGLVNERSINQFASHRTVFFTRKAVFCFINNKQAYCSHFHMVYTICIRLHIYAIQRHLSGNRKYGYLHIMNVRIIVVSKFVRIQKEISTNTKTNKTNKQTIYLYYYY